MVIAWAAKPPLRSQLWPSRTALDPAGVCTRRAGRAGRRGPTALLVADAAAALIGRALDATALAGLDQAARRACKPIDDKRGTIEYRIKVAGVMARRAATIACERAGKSP